MSGDVIVIGHRGASARTPENTMASFQLALDLGAVGIEFDVQLTSDGHAVVVHDASLDRTTTGSGPVFDATLDDVRSLDAGSWFGAAHAGAQVPLLDEVLALDATVYATWATPFTRTMPTARSRSAEQSMLAFRRSRWTTSNSVSA